MYAIVPPNNRGVITVYMSAMTEDGGYADDKSKPLYVGNPGDALLLRCNFSEIYSNVLITVTDGGGAIEFHPSLSMETGTYRESRECMISQYMRNYLTSSRFKMLKKSL